MAFLYYIGGGGEWGGVKEKIETLYWFCLLLPLPLPLFLLNNKIPSNLKSIVLVGHAFGGVHIHLVEF